MTRSRLLSGLTLLAVLLLASLSGCAGNRYSDDPAAARIQALTDFCIGYGALRDVATDMITIDNARDASRLSPSLVEGYASARAAIRPFCSADFDASTGVFDLDALRAELVAIRVLLVRREAP